MPAYPMLYEHNYPMPNDRYPPPYGQRVPSTVESMLMHVRPPPPSNSYSGDTAAVYSGPGRPPVYHTSDGYGDRDHGNDMDRYGNHTAHGMAAGDMGRPMPSSAGGYSAASMGNAANTGNMAWEGKYHNLTSTEISVLAATNTTPTTDSSFMTNDNSNRSDVNRE